MPHRQTLFPATLRNFALLVGLPALSLLGCGEGLTTPDDDLQQVAGDVNALGTPPATASTIAFETFKDDVGMQAATQSRTLIRSARAYQSFFGHAAPADVDFSREWVMFYSAGTVPTGGYQASFLALLRNGSSLIAITQLASPGSACVVNQLVNTPYALIKFAAQPGTSPRFYRSDTITDCVPGTDPCATVDCGPGTRCEAGKCVVSCGGLTGAACPGLGKCADDPNDKCDPAAGGADCPGICSCVQNVLCTADSKFDSSPSVCACVPSNPPTDPCATVKCAAGTHCDAGKCVSNPVACGGFAGTPCPGGGQCGDDPTDSCDPAKGGADCPGVCSCVQNVLCAMGNTFDSSPSVCACVPSKPVCVAVCAIYCQYGNVLDANGCPTCACNPPPTDLCATVKCAAGTHCDSGKCVSNGVACGGIAGIACPGLGKCGDDPSDSCDPAKGGADCPGVCSCVQNVLCAMGSTFDSSPSVCACVPASTNPCPADKCPSPAPLSVTTMCADGTTAGPTCALNASGVCAWTVTRCPAP